MVREGLDVGKTGRVMFRDIVPTDSKPGTVRESVYIQVGRNMIHGSDSAEYREGWLVFNLRN